MMYQPNFIERRCVRRECADVWCAAVIIAVAWAFIGGALYAVGYESLCAAAVAIAGVFAGAAMGAAAVERKIS